VTSSKLQIDQLWLDYDLGGGYTTEALVDWLVEKAKATYAYPFYKYVKEIIVHSANPVGSIRITQKLMAAGYVVYRVPCDDYFTVLEGASS